MNAYRFITPTAPIVSKSMSAKISILIASEASENCEALQQHVKAQSDFSINQVESLAKLKSCLESPPDILIIDTSSPSKELGFQLISNIRKSLPELLILPLIPATRRQLIERLVPLDIFFYIHTPIEPAETTLALSRAAEHLKLHRPHPVETTIRDSSQDFHGMIGSSSPMLKLFDLITRVAEDDDSTVLIRGESGTGKEMVAKALHAQSARKSKNFVPVNCAAIPDDLLESELFGYTKGAFTGATTSKIGRIQYADGGTLFLDEIGDMKPTLQAKLLRVIQEKEFEPVGALKSIPVDTRILAATHCDLEQLVSEGNFREDLYYRLSVIPLTIPPLRNRREDIPKLVEKFIDTFTTQRNRTPFTFSATAFNALIHFDWRGNVRELENLIQHMSILYSGKQVEFDDLPEKFLELRETINNSLPIEPSLQTTSLLNDLSAVTPTSISDIPWHEGQVDFRELISSFETELIVHAMKMTEGNKKEAARLLNLKRTTLLEKIKKKDLGEFWKK